MAKQKLEELSEIKITVLSEKGFKDSEKFLKELGESGGLQARHSDLKISMENVIGFASLIECHGKMFLMDATGREEELLQSLDARGYTPDEIEGMFLTHEHFDHIGGAPGFLKLRPEIDVWIPATFSEETKNKLGEFARNIHEVNAHEVVSILPGFAAVMMPGEFILQIQGELFLVANIADKGLLMMVGCAHPDIREMLSYARSRFETSLFGLYGGFHISPFHQWGEEEQNKVKAIVDSELAFVAANHCTGKIAVTQLEQQLPERFHRAEAGDIIIL